MVTAQKNASRIGDETGGKFVVEADLGDRIASAEHHRRENPPIAQKRFLTPFMNAALTREADRTH